MDVRPGGRFCFLQRKAWVRKTSRGRRLTNLRSGCVAGVNGGAWRCGPWHIYRPCRTRSCRSGWSVSGNSVKRVQSTSPGAVWVNFDETPLWFCERTGRTHILKKRVRGWDPVRLVGNPSRKEPRAGRSGRDPTTLANQPGRSAQLLFRSWFFFAALQEVRPGRDHSHT